MFLLSTDTYTEYRSLSLITLKSHCCVVTHSLEPFKVPDHPGMSLQLGLHIHESNYLGSKDGETCQALVGGQREAKCLT